MNENSVPIYVPVEYLNEVSAVIRKGLKTCKMSAKTRKELEAWWEAESSLMNDAVECSS